MESAGAGPILKLLLVLFLSVKGAPQQGAGRGPALEPFAPAGATGYAALDVAQLRALVRADPEVAGALFGGRTAEAAYGEAIEALCQRTRIDPGALREAVERVNAAGIWMTGLSRREYPRFVAVLDRGGAPDVLPALFGKWAAGEPEEVRTVAYAGRTLYGIGSQHSESIWIGEINGFVVLASDILAAESLLLKIRSSAPAAAVVSGLVPPILYAHADAGALASAFLSAAGSRDMEEFTAAGAFFDLPAWRDLTLRVDGKSAVLRAHFDPASPLAAALKPTDQLPLLLEAIPADVPFAVAVGVRDAARIWDLFESGFGHMAGIGRDPGQREEFLRDFSRETGLNVQTDVVSNLVAAALVAAESGKTIRLEHGVALYFEGRTPSGVLASAQVLAAKAARERDVSPEERAGVKVWRTSDTVIAVKGKTLMIAPCRGNAQASAARLLKHFIEGGESLRKTLGALPAGATAVATLDAARYVPNAGLDRVTARAEADGSALTLRLDGGSRDLAAGILRLLGDAALNPQAPR